LELENKGNLGEALLREEGLQKSVREQMEEGEENKKRGGDRD